jgi:hypothetical protein
MKKSIILYSFLLFASCDTNSSENNPEGVYTAKYEHEFAKTEDTLQLKKLNDANSFQIIRHSGVMKRDENKILPKEIISEVWNLDYDNEKKVLTELKGGKTLIWNPGEKTLAFGDTKYIKAEK